MARKKNRMLGVGLTVLVILVFVFVIMNQGITGNFVQRFEEKKVILCNCQPTEMCVEGTCQTDPDKLTAFRVMPPHPDLIASGEPLPKFFTDGSLREGVQPTKNIIQSNALARTGSGGADFNLLVVLVDFSDKPAQTDPSVHDKLMFFNSRPSVNHYFRENSYGKLNIITANPLTEWKRAPNTYAEYAGNNAGQTNSRFLAEQLIDMIDSEVNFADYDNDGDGIMDGLLIIHAGIGGEVSGNSNDIWSHKSSLQSPVVKDGVIISTYAIVPEYVRTPSNLAIGTAVHELGHLMLFLPDLYDTDSSSGGLGQWALMGSGGWNGKDSEGNLDGSSPSHLSPWSKMKSGFVDPKKPDPNLVKQFSLAPSETSSEGIYRLWINNIEGTVCGLFSCTSTDYFLIENRQKIGYDDALSDEGVLIWHIDDDKPDNTQEWFPGLNSRNHYKVAVEQADGIWGIEKEIDRGESHDLFGNFDFYFTKETVPSSRNYDGSESKVFVKFLIEDVNNNAIVLLSVNSFVCGDANNDGSVTIADVTFLINYLFSGGQQPLLLESADANGNGKVNIADVTYLVQRIFSGGPAPICPQIPPAGSGIDVDLNPTPSEIEEAQKIIDDAGLNINLNSL